jgi:inosine/xanthosine triphosphatase
MKIAVGSLNPVKVEAVKLAFSAAWPKKNFNVKGFQVASGVRNQPMSDLEAIKGARTRARQSLQLASADFGVGIEGGIQKIGLSWFDCGWVVVLNCNGLEGIGSTARIITPPAMITLIKQGLELGDVVDHFFKTSNAKQNEGHFGLMTNRLITRTSGYRDGVIMALVRFLHPNLFV